MGSPPVPNQPRAWQRPRCCRRPARQSPRRDRPHHQPRQQRPGQRGHGIFGGPVISIRAADTCESSTGTTRPRPSMRCQAHVLRTGQAGEWFDPAFCSVVPKMDVPTESATTACAPEHCERQICCRQQHPQRHPLRPCMPRLQPDHTAACLTIVRNGNVRQP